MTDKPDLVPFAKFDWNDALPDPADNLDVLLAKYARLRFVYEVNLRCDQLVCSRLLTKAVNATAPTIT